MHHGPYFDKIQRKNPIKNGIYAAIWIRNWKKNSKKKYILLSQKKIKK